MGKDPAQTWAGDYLPLISLKPWIRPTMRGARMVTANKIPGLRNELALGNGPSRQRMTARMTQSASLRAFLRLRLRASASFTRFFSPGFR